MTQRKPDLKLCSRLKELGFPQTSCFVWYQLHDFCSDEPMEAVIIDVKGDTPIGYFAACDAPLLSDMLEWLTASNINYPELRYAQHGQTWHAHYEIDRLTPSGHFTDPNPCNAVAKMIISILEKKGGKG